MLYISYCRAIPSKGGKIEFLDKKLEATERPREERAKSRQEKRAERLRDPELKLKTRMTVSGMDI